MANTFATYVKGPPLRPFIRHDNGFLDKFKPAQPGAADYAAYAKWRSILEGAEAAQGIGSFSKTNMPDALPAYRHFLDASGAPRLFSYERYVAGDASGRTTLLNQIAEAQRAALDVYMANFGSGEADFEFTGTALGAGNSVAFPYPATENWQKAIGAHNFWISGHVIATRIGPPGAAPSVDQLRFNLELTVHVEDMYNFNPEQHDIATGIPDGDNGRFEVTGLAKQYLNYATLTRTVVWNGRAVRDYDVKPNEAVGMRKPSDNRRLRNRT